MKINNSTPQHVQNIRFKRKVLSREKKKKLNIRSNSINKDNRFERKKQKRVIKVDAPVNFSLQDDAETMLKFIKKIKRVYMSRRSININMQHVENITCGSVALLLSVLADFADKQLSVYGNKPRNKKACRTLELSGFFNFMKGNIDKTNKSTKNNIICQGTKTVTPKDSAELIFQAMKTITGKKTKNQKIQSMLIEMMANSVNHAFKKSSNSRWWISASHDDVDKKVSFVFIDNGAGIAKTLGDNVLKKIKFKFFKDNLDLLSNAFKGLIGSRTGLDYRGRGLPRILKGATNNYFSKFTVITNNVYYTGDSSSSRLMSEDFSGTFYYFEISKENIHGA